MGLFDRGPTKPETGAAGSDAAFPDKGAPGAAKHQPKQEAEKTGKRYGIAQALALLRELPIDSNPDLVMRVVRKTLESNQVHVDDLVAEAKACAKQLEQTMATERATIAELERDIATRNAALSKLGQELAEMKHAGDRLAGAISVGAIKARPTAGSGSSSSSAENAADWERPSVMRLEERDLESVPSPEPIPPRGKGPGRP